MNLVLLAAFVAVCSAAKLDRTYLPPESAKTAGGSPGDIQTPLVRDLFNPGQSGLPKGAFDNDYDGVVVEAAAPGTRASSPGESGLGGDRISYGSSHSKVGGAAFKTNQQGFIPQIQTHTDQIESQTLQNFQQGVNFGFNTARPQAEFDKASNIVRFENNVGPQAYNYAFETDNGITAEENGVAVNGIQAEGGYSYTGDDGKVYKVTYTAGEGGYQPSGDHLPTPPPIPEEILKSLEQNAKEAAGGIVDDGSYDAEKYNVEDDRTKSDSNNEQRYNSGQFGVSESDAYVSSTFINQNTRVFENLNGPQQSQTSNDDVRNNIPSFQNNLQPQPTFVTALGKQPLSGAPFEQNNGQVQIDFSTPESDKKDSSNQEDNGDYSRPIFFGTPQLNSGTNNRFGIKQSYLPPTNNLDTNNRPTVSLNSYNSQNTAQGIAESSTFGSLGLNSNLNKPLNIGQSRPQSFPSNQFNQFTQNSNSQPSQSQFINGQYSDLNKNQNTQSGIQASYNNFNNIPSTLQPSLDLTTPFEDTPNSNKKLSTPNVPLPTQASFSDANSQSSNVPQIAFGTSNQNLNKNEIKQTYVVAQTSDQLTNTNINLSGNQQLQGPDHSYYYNQPSKPFNANKVTTPTFTTGNRPFNSGFNNGVVTKYPRPPTVAPTISTSMYNQYSNIPQSPSASFNDRFRPSTKYPQPPVVTQSVQSPTIPTKMDGFQEQFTGITQASVSPFPSTSTKYTSSKNQQSENVGLSQNFQINTSFQKDTTATISFNRDQATLSDSQVVQTANQAQPELSNNAPQLTTSQQYNGEIYEYNKPAPTLPTTESDEDSSTTPDNFSQFGQKIRPTIQTTVQNAQVTSNRGPQNNQLTVTRPQLQTNLQGQFNQNKYQQGITTTSFTQDFNTNTQQTIPSNNLQAIKPTSDTTRFTSGAFAENQPTTNYKGPLDFSTRIRPCCQGPRTSGQDVKDSRKPIQSQDQINSGISVQFGQENQKPGVMNENSFNTPSIGFRPQNLHSVTSQTGGEIFGGPRRPPSFDEATGYHY
ncbi:PREDICTED: probable serine/threonine-protein kinase DDB_G0282963 [Papilio polytes]|uniref:probable serine/threonine-protein kinase DDB_G0282963 n=1 Tax=Papilio polytes TaxID=76194 RepID=UPI000676186C|nr:PREDICTED: probable serine/threonine-protein kinase DDB_G0282963 [Papilio polytes]